MIGDFDPLLRAISGGYVEMLRVEEPSLEEIFLAFYSGSEGELIMQWNRCQLHLEGGLETDPALGLGFRYSWSLHRFHRLGLRYHTRLRQPV